MIFEWIAVGIALIIMFIIIQKGFMILRRIKNENRKSIHEI